MLADFYEARRLKKSFKGSNFVQKFVPWPKTMSIVIFPKNHKFVKTFL